MYHLTKKRLNPLLTLRAPGCLAAEITQFIRRPERNILAGHGQWRPRSCDWEYRSNAAAGLHPLSACGVRWRATALDQTRRLTPRARRRGLSEWASGLAASHFGVDPLRQRIQRFSLRRRAAAFGGDPETMIGVVNSKLRQ